MITQLINKMNFEELIALPNGGYTNRRSEQNSRYLLKACNGFLGYDDTQIRPEEYLTHYEKIYDGYYKKNPNRKNVISNIAVISGILQRCVRVGRLDKFIADEFKMKKNIQSNPDKVEYNLEGGWLDQITKINKLLKQETIRDAGKIVLTCYKHGYCMRVGEIFNTTLIDDELNNYLDLANKSWIIRVHKNQKYGGREFSVSDDFINDIKPYLRSKQIWLLAKGIGKYNKHTHETVGLKGFTSNKEIRKYYEEWNWNASGRDFPTKKHWSVNVLGHAEDTAVVHYTDNDKDSDNDVEEEIVFKPKVKPVIKIRPKLKK